jgi:hypothetical protein
VRSNKPKGDGAGDPEGTNDATDGCTTAGTGKQATVGINIGDPAEQDVGLAPQTKPTHHVNIPRNLRDGMFWAGR